MTLLTPPEKPEPHVITPDFRSPLEQWAVEAAKSIEVVPDEEGWERVVLVNDHVGLAEREEATIARCRSGDGGLVASAMHALVTAVRSRDDAAATPMSGLLTPAENATILSARLDARALLQAVESVIENREQDRAVEEDEADDGEPIDAGEVPHVGEDASDG